VLELFKSLIRRFEGCRLIAYLCPALVWTCGWGSTGADVVKGTTWSQAQADMRMEQDAIRFSSAVLKISPMLLAFSERHAVASDFAYNVGLAAYKTSTFRRKLEAGDLEAAKKELMKWIWGGGKKLPGLILRRHVEGTYL